MEQKNILITGGCGFIGSNFIKFINHDKNNIIVVDKLTYAGKLENIEDINCIFYQNDIGDAKIFDIIKKHKIDILVNFAAETHVDNSIDNPSIFIETNVNSTFSLIKTCLKYQKEQNNSFKFIHISTDEVFGDLELNDHTKFNENTPYNPSSPYSASKAAIDLIIKSYIKTFNFNAIILNCSNNFGPNQLKEKLIPKTIENCLNNVPIPVYGNGLNIRDWIFVDDFCQGIYLAMTKGKIGQSYCFGANNERTNIDIINYICGQILKKLGKNCKNLINFVEDRKGHDKKYAIDFSKATHELGFIPKISFEKGMDITIENMIKFAH